MDIKLKHVYLLLFSGMLFLNGNYLYGKKMNSYKNLMPVPAKMSVSEGCFRLDSSFAVSVNRSYPRLDRAVGRTIQRLAGRTGLFLPQSFFNVQESQDSVNFKISVSDTAKIRFGINETYRLTVTDNQILLTAVTDIGAIRGLETFLQLLDSDEKGYFFPAVQITDAPRFPWRGLLIDACRHFMPPEVIKRNLDGMAAVKMNVLHWHLSEDQGFRVECKTFPKLHQKGSDGLYYTQTQIKEIIRYANDRGIRVIPEFDLPGHATSWLAAYPKLASAPGPYHIERGWGVKDPVFNPASEQTYTFLDAFFKEMSALFNDDYIHIGGDENNGKQWDANPEIQKFMKSKGFKDNHALQNYFNEQLLAILTRYHKKMIGWDEILHENMPKDIVLQSWRGKEAMIKAAQRGYRSLLSNGYYIDLIQPAFVHYLNDPLPEDSPLTAEQKKSILGGEATMWSELVSAENIDSRIWPRTAAIAERFWSPVSVRDVDDMYRRLEILSFHLEELGLSHKKNYEMMLRRLTGGGDITALKTLVDVLEPIKNYTRHRQRKLYSYTPLTRVVDAARPDAAVARNFRKRVAAFLKTGGKNHKMGAELETALTVWKNNYKCLEPIIAASPVLWEIEPMAQNVSRCAEIGLEALKRIRKGEKADAVWLNKSANIIQNAKKPCAQTELMILPAIEALREQVR